jgi:hypothetical protein
MGKALDELSRRRPTPDPGPPDVRTPSEERPDREVNVGNMTTLVEGLASFSRRIPTLCSDLNELLRRTIDFVKPQNRLGHIHFKFTPDPILPMVNVDPPCKCSSTSSRTPPTPDRGGPAVKKVFIETQFDPNTARADFHQRQRPRHSGGVPSPHLRTPLHHQATGQLRARHRLPIAANHRGTIRALNLQGPGAQFLLYPQPVIPCRNCRHHPSTIGY